MSKIDELDIKYDTKRHILVILIVIIVLLLVFVFFPLLLDLFFNEPSRTREPSERLNDSFPLLLNLIKSL
jgi:hypothetical protein